MKDIQEALREQLMMLESMAKPMRDAMKQAEEKLAPLEGKIKKVRQALDLVIDAS